MNLYNEESSTKCVDKSMCFEVPSNLNISNVNSNVSLNRDFSADYIQRITKMYNDELQMSNAKHKNNFSYMDMESCSYSKDTDISNNRYIYNTIPLSNTVESENANSTDHKTNVYHHNSMELETNDRCNQKYSPSSTTYEQKQESEARQNKYCDNHIRGATDESLFTIKNDLLIKEIESNVKASLTLNNSKELACTDISTLGSLQCDRAEEKTHGSGNEKISQERIIYNSNFFNNLNSVPNAIYSLDKLHPTYKLDSDKNTSSPFTTNAYASYQYFNGSPQSKKFSHDDQLNYSIESSLMSSHNLNDKHDLVQSNRSNMQKPHSSSLTGINESTHICEEQINQSYGVLSEKYSHSCPEHLIPLGSIPVGKKHTLDRIRDKNDVTSSSSIVHEHDSENMTQKKLYEDSIASSVSKKSTIEGNEALFFSSKSFKKDKTSIKKQELKVYSLDDIRKGKSKMPKVIFTPLVKNLSVDGVTEQNDKNKKLKQFMNHCNESVNLIMKYPRIEKKQTNTIRMPPSFTSSMVDHIGLPIIYEDDFDRKNQHPNVVNLHMGNVFEKHVFNMLKNKKQLGKDIFKEKHIYDKYNYKNDKGFWISNIDKERLVNPELNDSYVTELVYEKAHSYDQEMEILNTCENYNTTVPPVQKLYEKNNFCKFLCNTQLYVPNLKPPIATTMRRYDVAGVSDYKISHMSFGIEPVYKNEKYHN